MGGGREMGCQHGQTLYRGQAPWKLVMNRDPSHKPAPIIPWEGHRGWWECSLAWFECSCFL